MSRFDRIILVAVLGLGLTVGLLSVASARLGPTVDTFSTLDEFDGTSVGTQIGVSFTTAMNLQSVERNFRIEPRTGGDFNWSGNEMIFRPKRNLSYHTRYTVTVSTGATDPSGKHILRAYRTSFTTQSPHLMYLGSAGDERNRLVLASIGGRRQVVGPNDGLVSDYSLSFDSSLVVYVKAGSAGERADELWLLSLADNSTQRVFRRTDWSISQPHLSPDNSQVVFLAENVRVCRQYYGCFRDRRPEVYFLDLRSGEVHPFHSSDTPISNFVTYSPGGQVAFTDLSSALTLANPDGRMPLHIPNSGNSPEFAGFDASGAKAAFVGQTPESQGGDILVYAGARYQDVSRGVYDSSTPAFATSGKRIAYAGYSGEKGIEPVYGISVYSFATHRTQHLTNDHDWSDWTPAWSLDDHYLAFIRSVPQEEMYMGSGEIWVMRSTGGDIHPLGGIGRHITWVS